MFLLRSLRISRISAQLLVLILKDVEVGLVLLLQDFELNLVSPPSFNFGRKHLLFGDVDLGMKQAIVALLPAELDSPELLTFSAGLL